MCQLCNKAKSNYWKKKFEQNLFNLIELEEYFEEIKTASYKEGFEEGFEEGKENGFEEDYSQGFLDGKEEGYNEGFSDGKKEGFEEGKRDTFDKLQEYSKTQEN